MKIKNMKIKLIGKLLNLANRSRSGRTYYQLKNHLISKYGVYIDPADLQHIVKYCWTCEGTGVFNCNWKYPEPCCKCLGSGIYEEFFCILFKYRVGNYIFHRPGERQFRQLKSLKGITTNSQIITGYVNHNVPKGHLGDEAYLWLLLFFDRKSFFKEWGTYYLGKKYCLPLIQLSNIIYSFKRFSLKTVLEKCSLKKNVTRYDGEDMPF